MGSTELAANLFRATQTDEKLRRENVRGETILFLHTGGTPLFFDDMKLF